MIEDGQNRFQSPRTRLALCRQIVTKIYGDQEVPQGLLTEIYKAVGEAELRGFKDCLRFFESRTRADNENHSL